MSDTVQEARERVQHLVDLTGWSPPSVSADLVPAALDALIEAARAEGRAEERARFVAVVAGLQGYEPNRADGGLSMVTTETGSWLLRSHITEALTGADT